MKRDDIIDDIFERIKEALGESFNGEISIKMDDLKARVRYDWAGNEIYISKKGDRKEMRHKAMTEIEKGSLPHDVASKSGISRAQVYRLLNLKRKSHFP